MADGVIVMLFVIFFYDTLITISLLSSSSEICVRPIKCFHCTPHNKCILSDIDGNYIENVHNEIHL